MIKRIFKIILINIIFDFIIKRRIFNQPCQKQFLSSQYAVFLLSTLLHRHLFLLLLLINSFFHLFSAHRCTETVHHPLQFLRCNAVTSGNGVNINVSLQFLRKLQQSPCHRFHKRSSAFRIRLFIIFLQYGDFKHKTALRCINSFLKGLYPKIFDKFIRIFIGVHMDHPHIDTGRFQDRNRSEGRFLSCTITVIGQTDFLSIPFQQNTVLHGKGRTKRSHRIGETCLMHSDHIHISFTDNHI